MPAKPLTTEFLHSLPPEGPHTITVHIPTWDSCRRLRDGDPTLFSQLKSIYPRFAPFGPTAQLAGAIKKKLGILEDRTLLLWLAPDALTWATEFATSDHRADKKFSPSELAYRIVDIQGTRLYAIVYPAAKAEGMAGAWQNPGVIVSTRLAEDLLAHVEELKEVPFGGNLASLPKPTWLAEGPAHAALRERISSLMHRAAIDPELVKVKPQDVYLYPTGMASIHRTHEALLSRRVGTVIILGAVFHNTWDLYKETKHGYKHFAQVDGKSNYLAALEAWLDGEAKAGKPVSYCFVEFPSNPIIVSVDLKRLRQLADKYDFVLCVDDTLGSFSNLDLTPAADIVVTSTTKSFSGYADVMGGSAILNPSSPRFPSFAPIFAAQFRNEVFIGDADRLLSNSNDYLARSATLNANAAALTSYLATQAADPASPVLAVLYPPQSNSLAHYQAFMRRATEDFTPGYGCLFSVDFRSKDVAEAFHDNLHFHGGPHLGAHLSLAVPYNDLVLGKNEEEYKYHMAYGMRAEQVRISVGLEDKEELLEVVKEALEAAAEVMRKEETGALGVEKAVVGGVVG